MWRIASLGVIAFLCGLPSSAEEPNNPLKALETKLHGHWYGQGPCDGQLIFHANGSVDRKFIGPGGDSFKGTWKMEWNALPPTLKLQETNLDNGAEVETLWKVRELDHENLAIQYVAKPPLGETKPIVYRREQKKQ